MHGEDDDATIAQTVEAHLPVDGVGEAGPAHHRGVDLRGVEGERRGVETEVAEEP